MAAEFLATPKEKERTAISILRTDQYIGLDSLSMSVWGVLYALSERSLCHKEMYSTFFTRMRKADLLVLDDWGSQQSSSWANEELLQLVNQRCTDGSPMVITTSLKDLRGTDERLRSRLSDRGW